jgi:lipopolysaccharide/colanic/teichoic acid biosynthesis glycosyltransferase
VKAGITGWAQVHGLRGDTPLDRRIEYDLFYIRTGRCGSTSAFYCSR